MRLNLLSKLFLMYFPMQDDDGSPLSSAPDHDEEQTDQLMKTVSSVDENDQLWTRIRRLTAVSGVSISRSF